MVINIILPFFPVNPSGGAKIIFEYSNYLVKRNNIVNIYYLPDYCVPIKRIPHIIEKKWRKIIQEKSRVSWFKIDKRIRRFSIENISENTILDGDVVIATGVGTAKDVKKLSEKKGKKIYFIQGFENWGISEEEVYDTYCLGMHNIVVAMWLKKIVDKHSMSPSTLISNAVDTRIFKCNMPLDKRTPHSVVFHFRKEIIKGCKYAFEALDIVRENYPDLKVDIISTEKKPDNLSSTYNFHRNVTPIQVADINNNAQVFLCTSIKEGFGLPGLEAMACGCAFVSTRYLGVLEYSVDGVNSLLSPVKDSKKLAINIMRLFEDEDLRMRIASAGIRTAKERSIEMNCKKFEQIIIDGVTN